MQPIKAFKAYSLRPLKFIREIFSKKTLNGIIGQFNNPNQSDELKALTAALGIFIGIMPIWGFQTLAAIFLAFVFKLNKALVVVFSQVSFPPFFPLILFLSYKAGKYWVDDAGTKAPTKTSGQNISIRLWQYIYGSITLAIAAAIITSLLTFSILKLLKAIKQYRLIAMVNKAL